MSLPRSLLLVGAGKMGGALLKGWLDNGLATDALHVVDPQPSSDLVGLAQSTGFSLNQALSDREPPEAVVLAVKPQMFSSAVPGLKGLDLAGSVVVSVMAGKRIADLAAELPIRAVVRAMPNTPAAIGRGVTGAYANDQVTVQQRAATNALLAAVGKVEWLPREDLIDAVTAVSGSGPAYVYFLTECLAEAGRSLGLAPEVAVRLARATVEGTGALLSAEPGRGADQLRRDVTSPAGTTAAALEVLQSANGLQALMTKAVAAARDRARELAG